MPTWFPTGVGWFNFDRFNFYLLLLDQEGAITKAAFIMRSESHLPAIITYVSSSE